MAELTERLDKVEVIPQAPDTVPAAWRSFSGTRRPMRQRRMHIGEPGTGVPLITHTEPYFAAGSLQAYATAVSSNVVYVLESSDLVDQADASL